MIGQYLPQRNETCYSVLLEFETLKSQIFSQLNKAWVTGQCKKKKITLYLHELVNNSSTKVHRWAFSSVSANLLRPISTICLLADPLMRSWIENQILITTTVQTWGFHILNPPTVQQLKNADVPSWLMPTREKLHKHSSILSLSRKEYSLMFVLSQTILNFFIEIPDTFIYWREKLVHATSKDYDQRRSQPCHSPMSWFILPLSLAL
jgi:hypothetical protein